MFKWIWLRFDVDPNAEKQQILRWERVRKEYLLYQLRDDNMDLGIFVEKCLNHLHRKLYRIRGKATCKTVHHDQFLEAHEFPRIFVCFG